MRQFVILEHRWDGLHYDFMVETAVAQHVLARAFQHLANGVVDTQKTTVDGEFGQARRCPRKTRIISPGRSSPEYQWFS